MSSSQNERVLAALRKHRHGITQVDFLLPDVIDGGPPITRLGARIKDLRNGGEIIVVDGLRDRCAVYKTTSTTASLYVVDPGTGCWNWTGPMYPAGYGRAGAGYAHRDLYEQIVGPIPEDLELDHLCRNRGCVNPSHLEPVTHAENVRRGAAAKLTPEDVAHIRASPESQSVLGAQYGVAPSTIWKIRRGGSWGVEKAHDVLPNGSKTHCKHGHEFTDENTRQSSDGSQRVCRECVRLDSRRRRARVRPGTVVTTAPEQGSAVVGGEDATVPEPTPLLPVTGGQCAIFDADWEAA